MLKTTLAVTTAAIATLAAIATPAESATVRRHLHCEVLPTFQLQLQDLGHPNVSTAAVATNNWSFIIPKGTKFTYTVNDRSYTYNSTKSLAPNAKVVLGDARGASTCNASIPG